jgi:hypothetical protein
MSADNQFETHFATDAQYRRAAGEHEAKVKAHATAEVIARALGDFAPDPAPSESSLNYRKRLASNFQKLSKDWGKVDLKLIPPDTFAQVEVAIYKDAAQEAREPTSLTIPRGQTVMRETRDASGRIVRKYFGDERGVWAQFQNPLHTGRLVIPK